MKRLNVLYSSSDAYISIASVSICSLLKNNITYDNITIFFIANGVSQDNIEALECMIDKYKFAHIKFIDSEILDKSLEDLNVPKFQNSYATFQKIFINQIIPDDIDYLLYIDSDTVINRDLGGIDEIANAMNNPIAVVKVPFYSGYHKVLGVSKDAIYPNCGVILFDIRKWKMHRCEERIIEYLTGSTRQFRAADQDIITIVLEREMDVLPAIYNVGAGWKFYGPKNFAKIHDGTESNFYSLTELEEAVDNPIILHCLGGFYGRPWEINSRSPFVREWEKYANYTPWKEKRDDSSKKFMFQVQKIVYTLLPRQLYFIILKIMIRIETKIKYRNK